MLETGARGSPASRFINIMLRDFSILPRLISHFRCYCFFALSGGRGLLNGLLERRLSRTSV